MLSSFLLTSRETLEAALVVGIVMAYLNKTERYEYKKTVYYGIAFGIIASILAAVMFTVFAGGFSGKSEEIFEGATMLIAAALLSTMVLWMLKQKHRMSKNIQERVHAHIRAAELNKRYAWGLFILISVAVLREGVETVIFLNAVKYESGISLLGSTLGIAIALIAGYLFFSGTRKVNLRKFFSISSVLLILFAAGLVAHGIHELEEAGIVPIVVEHVWDINPAVNADGSFPLLHEKGAIGSFFVGLFGYNGNPSLVEVLSYAAYLGVVFIVYRKIEKTSSVKAA